MGLFSSDDTEIKCPKRSLDQSFSDMDGITPVKQRIKMETDPFTPEVRNTKPDSVTPLPKISSPGAMSDSSVDSLCSIEGRDPLELPVFTPTVKCALRDGDCNPTIWNMVRILGCEKKVHISFR